jgi:predicted metal-dependent HD superfamily phosphohydrolase
MSDVDDLAARWRGVWTFGHSQAVYNELVARHAEPHRAYHTLEHIEECLRHLDMARHLIARPVEVELAVWFHDAVYDPRRGDNEEQSAALARQRLRAGGADEGMAARVADLIQLTNHAHPDLTGDAAVLCDVDLAILGAEPARFDRYDAAISREYDWVPLDIYRIERGHVLARFLDRPRVYHTSYFYDMLEARARANLWRAAARYR